MTIELRIPHVEEAQQEFVVASHILLSLASTAAASPVEICGFLVGDDSVDTVILADNISERPTIEYAMSHQTILETMQFIEDNGLAIFAVFHSHVMGGTIPSNLDRHFARESASTVQLIIAEGEVRAYTHDFATEVQLVATADHVHCIRCSRVIHFQTTMSVNGKYLCGGCSS